LNLFFLAKAAISMYSILIIIHISIQFISFILIYFILLLNFLESFFIFFFYKKEIKKCNSGASVKDCQSVATFNPGSYCTYYGYLYALRENGEIGCKYDLEASRTSVFELKDSKISELMLNEISMANVDLSKVVAIHCSEEPKKCSQTTGFIKDKDLIYYKIVNSSEDVNSEADISILSCNKNNKGKLATVNGQVVLCLSEKKYATTSDKEGSNYLLENNGLEDLSPSSPFNNNSYLPISVDLNGFVLNNQLSGIFILKIIIVLYSVLEIFIYSSK